MSVTLVGSIGIDDIITPKAKARGVLGGSASYASYAISLFSRPQVIAVVGTDFQDNYLPDFSDRGIDTRGVEIVPGETFRWCGEYLENFNERITHWTHLNVFADFDPKVPAAYKEAEFVFLANIDPDLQLKVLREMKAPRFTLVDTMELWINIKKNSLLELFSQVSAVIINESEAQMLFGTRDLFAAAKEVVKLGPEWAIIKKGEHGVILYSKKGELFILPAYPVENVVDPTGAGDSFAGAFIGYLAQQEKVDFHTMRHALAWSTIVASFTIEDFSVESLKVVDRNALVSRFNHFLTLTQLKP